MLQSGQGPVASPLPSSSSLLLISSDHVQTQSQSGLAGQLQEFIDTKSSMTKVECAAKGVEDTHVSTCGSEFGNYWGYPSGFPKPSEEKGASNQPSLGLSAPKLLDAPFGGSVSKGPGSPPEAKVLPRPTGHLPPSSSGFGARELVLFETPLEITEDQRSLVEKIMKGDLTLKLFPNQALPPLFHSLPGKQFVRGP